VVQTVQPDPIRSWLHAAIESAALLYGPRVQEVIERRWGAEYDPARPYDAWIREVSLGAA
jgi:hypothetical protein